MSVSTFPVMDVVRFGQSGLRVGDIGLGTWTFGRETPPDVAFEMMDRFVEFGGTLIESADVYNEGASEQILGGWIESRQNRAQILIATKCHFSTGPLPNDRGSSRKHIIDALDASLARLHTDYVDLYLLHCCDPGVPIEETLSTLNDLVRAGRIRYIGASNFLGWQIVQAVLTSRQRAWAEFVTVQNEYSLLARGNEWEVIPACRELGLALMPWSPLGGGWLTGKYHRGVTGPLPGTRVAETAIAWQPDSWESRGNEQTWSIVDALLEVASARGVPPAQVALNWVRQKPQVASPIVGARTLEHLETNLHCVSWSLTPEEMTALDEASAPPMLYPYRFVRQMDERDGRSLTRMPGVRAIAS